MGWCRWAEKVDSHTAWRESFSAVPMLASGCRNGLRASEKDKGPGFDSLFKFKCPSYEYYKYYIYLFIIIILE